MGREQPPMTTTRLHETEHRCLVTASAAQLYDLVADVTRWPAVFGPTVHVQHLERGERAERFRIWAVLNGAVKSWTSRRELDPEARSVRFEQEVSQAPIASMGGEWRLRPVSDDRTEVVLLHHFSTTSDDAETVEWVNRAVDRNSDAELAALRAVAERAPLISDVVFSFEDTVSVRGSASAAYEFVDRADRWPQRLPHVRRVSLTEPEPGVQDLEMDTATADGSAHRTRSHRICAEPSWIAYKQVVLPELLAGHSGLWTFSQDGDSATLRSRHTVSLDPSAVRAVLGSGSTLADAREHVRAALSANSATTLRRAGAFAQQRSGA